MRPLALSCIALLVSVANTSWAQSSKTPSPTAPPRTALVMSVDKPVATRQLGPGHWFIDFGRAAFGNVQLTVPAAVAKATVAVHLGEAVTNKNRINRNPGGTVRYQQHALKLEGPGEYRPQLTWAPPGWMKDGWLNLPPDMPQVMPFRYVEIENAPAGFSVDWVQRVYWTIPFDDDASHFVSSSEELNRVWEFSKYSIKATTFLGLYVDGDRERKPYEADALLNQLCHYCTDDDYQTARLTHEYLLQYPTWPTEWRLQSVLIAWYDFLWSGNDESLKRHYETLKSRAMLDRRADNGLFVGYPTRSKPPGLEDIIDWPAGERDDYDMSAVSKTVVTAFHYQALVYLEKIARQLGKSQDAKQFARQAEQTLTSFNDQLWDDKQQCYVDGVDPKTGVKSLHASSHANFFPLAFNMVPTERIPAVTKLLKQKGMVCSVYGSQFLLDALYASGEGEAALELLTSRGLRSWLNMMDKVGTTVALEAWDPTLKPNLDWNHAWGAAPANIIPRGLMGIEPIAPGFTRFQVKPQLGSLRSASVKMPSPRGPISLSVEQNSEAAWKATIDVPQGAVAEFHVPTTNQDQVQVNSAPLAIIRQYAGRMVIELSSGTHTISIQP